MGKSLVIVESPAKVKTISKFLGSGFIVKSSVGHIRDLAKSSPVSAAGAGRAKKTSTKPTSEQEKRQLARRKLIQRMGIDPENDWQAQYEILPGKEKVLKALKEASSHLFPK